MPRPAAIDFAVIGAQRAGSTHLAARLADHAGVYMPRDEVPYFEDPFFANTPPSELERALSRAAPGQLRGIHRPELLHRSECAARLAAASPEMRVLAVLRDPVARAISAHAWYVQFGLVPFEPVADGLRRLLSGWSDPRWPRAHEVLSFGRYGEAIGRHIALLGRDRVFCCRQEELRGEAVPAAVRFLSLDPSPADDGAAAVTDQTNEGVYSTPRLRWLRARHRLAFSWDDQDVYRYRPRRWRRPVRGSVAAAVVGVDRLVLRPVFGRGRVELPDALLDDLAGYYAGDLNDLERQLGWDLAAWRR